MDATIPTILAVVCTTYALVGYAWLRERERHRRTRQTLKWWQRHATVKSDVWGVR